MELADLKKNWDTFGRTNPLWAIQNEEGPVDLGEQKFFDTGQEYVTRVLELLISLDADPRRDRALDFGCGVGRLTFALAREFDQVDGVDISASMIDGANEYRARFEGEDFGTTDFHLNTNLDLSLFDDGQFSFILSLVVLQHMKPEFGRSYIAEFSRLLEPGGVLAFQVPVRRETATLRIRGRVGQALRRLRYDLGTGGTAVMEMYGTPKSEIERQIRSNGLRLIAAVPDDRARTWESYTYVATRD